MTYLAMIHPTACIDQLFRHFQGGKEPIGITYRPTMFGNSVSIGAGAIIGLGVVLEDAVVIDHQCIVEPNTTIGRNSLLIYRAIIGGEAVIGNDCVIGGFIAERSIVGARCRVFGQLVHRQADTTLSWDEHDLPEPSAQIGDDSFIGFGAIIVGGVTIGPKAYVCAGAIVTKSVPPGHIALGVNQIVPSNEWRGKLADNPVFSNG